MTLLGYGSQLPYHSARPMESSGRRLAFDMNHSASGRPTVLSRSAVRSSRRLCGVSYWGSGRHPSVRMWRVVHGDGEVHAETFRFVRATRDQFQHRGAHRRPLTHRRSTNGLLAALHKEYRQACEKTSRNRPSATLPVRLDRASTR